jgi:hypothetical protein
MVEAELANLLLVMQIAKLRAGAAPELECRGSRGRVTAGTEIGQWECEIVVGDGMNFRSCAL